jgi:serine phosphatase RsbU (regulator of sigma subunit)
MSLRLRLVLAFFLLSVVPLGALTLVVHASNSRAMRETAGRETELLAGELSQRMQVVTARLTEQVEHLVELAESNEAATEAARRAVQQSVAVTRVQSAAATEAADDAVAGTLGQLAMLLNNVELRDSFRGRGAGGGGRGGRGQGRRGDAPGPAAPPPVAQPATVPPGAPAAPPPPVPPRVEDGRGRGEPRIGPPPAGTPGGRGPAPGTPGDRPADERITIDMRPIRLDILKQYASEDEFMKLPEADRQRIIGEVNQRMLGIAMGIRMGAAEAQRRVTEAQKAASEKAREAVVQARAGTPAAPKPVTAPLPPLPPMERKAKLSGSRLDITLERNGQVVRQLNAEVDLPNLLGTVFSTTRRDRGEVPFAVARDGRIYTPTKEDQQVVETLGDVMLADTPPGTFVQPDWVIVTTADPTGSGLKFGIARPVGDSVMELRRASARNGAIGLGFIGLALIGIVPLSGRLTRNLSVLSGGVNRIAQGDYRARVEVRSSDEVGRLATAFNRMAEDVERHERAAVGQERIRRELELGRQIQHDMLPRTPLRLGLTEVKGVSVPAREVGGDFFNYFEVADGQIALLVGDVSGKGVGAALLMANIQASLRTRLALGQDLAAIANALDIDIDANTPGSVYATIFMAILDIATHRIRYVNAGHNPQYLLRGTGGLEEMPSTGLPIGMLSGRGYREGTADVAEGDLLFFYTDGCVEAESETGEMFSAERLETVLRSAAAPGAGDALALVETAVNQFRGTREPFDDATMMVVKVG